MGSNRIYTQSLEAGKDDVDTRTWIFTLRDIVLYAENDAKNW
jgi:hypothetical protein